MNRAPGKLIALAAACLFLEGCAQMGPPLPPSLELPKAPNDLRVTRKGDRVTLTWTQPSLTTRHLTVRYLGPTRVCRSAASELTDCGTPVASVAPLPLSMARSESNP